MSEHEKWLPIPGWPDYEASSMGEIASIKRGYRQILEGGRTDTGYRNVLLYSDGVREMHRVHVLVALTFHGPRPEGMQVRHLDGDQLNNESANLIYGTPEENLEDKRLHSWLRRNANPNRKLKTHCVNGHPWVEENLYLPPNGTCPSCRTCRSESMRRHRARRALRAAGIEVAA